MFEMNLPLHHQGWFGVCQDWSQWDVLAGIFTLGIHGAGLTGTTGRFISPRSPTLTRDDEKATRGAYS